MPNAGEILREIFPADGEPVYDDVRCKYLSRLSSITGRNVIAYYSSWLTKPGLSASNINDYDKNAFMSMVHNLDRGLGLDLILHTPGGDIAATESIVEYLHTIFDGNIRAIIPQLAMSAGTMMACSCKSILMGKQSNLGPIDPQLGGVPAYGVLDEFEEAIEGIDKNPASLELWKVIISKYHPTYLGECKKAIEWSHEIVVEWLQRCMLKAEHNKIELSQSIAENLADHDRHKAHNRHITVQKCKDMGLKIEMLEDNQAIQDTVLSIHHSFMYSLDAAADIVKIVENQNGIRFIIRGS